MTGADRTLAEVLEHCRPSITGALIDPARLVVITGICERLPIQFSGFWGLETGLGDPEAQVDLLTEIKRGSARHQILAGDSPSVVDALCATFPAWAELRRFARAWALPDHDAAAFVKNVWIELDLIAAARATPPADGLQQPSVFWGPDRLGRDDWHRFEALAAFVSEHFSPFPKALPLARLEGAVRGLPDGAQVFQLGAMQSRGDVMLRMCVNQIDAATIPGWLAAQQWPGDVAALETALRVVGPLARTFALDVDFTAVGIGPKIGIECYQHWPELETAQWQPLLDHIGTLGLLRDAKRDAITAYPAKTTHTVRYQFDHQHDDHMFPVVYQNIHHVKLSFVKGAFVEAKGYLGVTRPGFRLGFPMRQIPDGEPEEWLAS